jgi:hypothetical protein
VSERAKLVRRHLERGNAPLHAVAFLHACPLFLSQNGQDGRQACRAGVSIRFPMADFNWNAREAPQARKIFQPGQV